jgi:hypothetical protein
MSDDQSRRPAWDDRSSAGKARDFADPPPDDPPDHDVPMEPPEEADEAGSNGDG